MLTHTPQTPEAIEVAGRIHRKASELEFLINESMPQGREKSLAITNLEQSVMWASAGVARTYLP